MAPTERRLHAQLEGGAQLLVAALVFVVTGAAGNTRYLNFPVGLQLRWVVLFELAGVAALYAVARGRPVAALRVPAALAGALLGLAALSALWSPDVLLTVVRAGSLGLLLVAVGGLAWGAVGDAGAVGRLLLAVVAGVCAVAVAGLVVLWLRPGNAAVPATLQSPWRYNGLGANPNTVAMLLALALPPAVLLLANARSWASRAAVGAAVLLFDGSIVASGSRGALVGALVGTLCVALAVAPTPRQRAVYAAAVVGAFAVSVGISQIPQPATHNPRVNPVEQQSTVKPVGAERVLPLEDEIGFPRPGSSTYHRSLFSSGGRIGAWRGALGQWEDRPILGYGFGTEERVFVDRYYLFFSSKVENSYIGTLLQLGVVGLAELLALVLAVVAGAWRARQRLDDGALRVAAACLGMVLCGLVLAGSQSYLTSVGSPAAPVFWIALALLAAACAPARPRAGELRAGEGDER